MKNAEDRGSGEPRVMRKDYVKTFLLLGLGLAVIRIGSNVTGVDGLVIAAGLVLASTVYLAITTVVKTRRETRDDDRAH